VRESVWENPRRSISRCSQELGLSATSTWRILRRDLGLHPYKIQLTQELKVNDHRQRRMFADWVLEQFTQSWKLTQISQNKSLAMRSILMNRYMKKQNCRTIPIHARYTSAKCIPRKSLFGADFDLAESSVFLPKQALP